MLMNASAHQAEVVSPDGISLHPQYPATSSTTAAQKKIIPYVSIHSKETQKYNCQSQKAPSLQASV